ncbi:MAG: PAS domain S-box protein [Chloroflexi bacterium]|nr:PAS domain S-box protein [Chloroflexota bacterium]
MMRFTRRYLLFLLPLLLLVRGALLASKIVRVGVYHNPPLSFVDEEGLPQGFVIDILNDIARNEAWVLEFVSCEWSECLLALEAGEIDLLAPIAFSEERAERFDFSEETIITNWGQVYVQSDNIDISIVDLAGKKIALLEGDIHASVFQFMLDEFGIDAEILYLDTYADIMLATETEEAFAGVVNHLFAIQHAHEYDVQQSSIIFNPVEVRFAATKGKHETLLFKLDSQISALKNDTKSLYYKALSTWLHKESERNTEQFFVIIGGALLFLSILLGINHLLRTQIKKQTAEIVQSKEELALIIDHIPSMVSYLDTDLRYIYVDQSYADWYGFKKEDVVGKLVSEVLPAKNYEKVRPNLEKVVAEAREINYQRHITRYNGEEAVVAISYIPHLDPKGKIKAFFATVRDITEKVKAKEALREREEQYRSLADNSLVGIYIIQNGVMLFANQGLANLFGYKRASEMQGKYVKELVAAQDWKKVQEEMRRKESGEKNISHISFKGLRLDGSTFNAEIRSHLVPHEGGTAIQGVLIDITDLVEVEERFRTLSEASFEAIFISEKGICLEQNLAAEKLFGYSLEEAIGQPGTNWIAQEDRDMVMHHMLSGYEEPYRVRALRKDGSTFPAEIHGKMMYYKERAVRVTGMQDITTRVEAENKLAESKKRFEKVIAQAPTPMAITNSNGDIEYFNNLFTKTYGYTLEDANTLEKWWKIAYPNEDYRQEAKRTWEEAIIKATKTKEEVETQVWDIRTKDGISRRVEFDTMHLGDISVVAMNDITERSNAEHSLRESEKKFKDLFEKSKDANLIIHNGVFIDFNQAAIDLLGYKNKKDLLNTPPEKLSPDMQPDGRGSKEKASEMIEIALEKGSHRFIWYHQRANSEIFPVEVLLTTITTEKNQALLHTVWRDITDRIRKENIIKVRLALAEFSFSHSMEDVLQKTIDEAEKLTNSKIGFYHFLNEDQKALSLQAWSSKTLDGYCTIEDPEKHYPIERAGVWVECIKTGQPTIHNDYASLPNKKGLPDGHAALIRQLVVPVFRQDKIVALLGVGNKATNYDQKDVEIVISLADLCWEVAERKITEKLLRESEEELQSVLEGSRAGSWDWDIQKEKTQRNENWANMLGYTLEEIGDKLEGWSNLVHPDDIKDVSGDLEAHLEGKTPSFESEYRMQHKDGHYIWVLDRARVTQRDSNAKALRISGTQINISERVKAEENLQQHAQQLEALNKITAALTTSLQLENLLETILKELANTINFDSASVFLTAENEQVFFAHALGEAKSLVSNSFPLHETLMQGIKDKKPLILDDAKEAPFYTHWEDAPDIRGWMGIPLIARGLVLGYLTFDSYEPYAFSTKDASLAESFAPHAAQAIYNAHLHKEIQESNQQLETLNAITAALSTSLELKDVLALILEKIKLAISFDSVTVFLLKDEGLEVVAEQGLSSDIIGKIFPLENALMKIVFQTKKPLILSDAKNDNRFEDWGNISTTRSWMGIPLIANNEVIGILTLDNNKASVYADEQIAIALPIATQAAQAIENARLYERVIADSNEVEKRVQKRTEELQTIINLTTDREIRMAELKKVISQLRDQLEEAGHVPVANDPLISDNLDIF